MVAIKRAVAKPKGSVVFAACVDEEVNGIGTQAAIRDGLRADWAVIGEPTELQPIRACRGNCYFEVEIGGRAAHAGSPEKGVNAIYGAMQAIAATQRHGAELAASRHAVARHSHGERRHDRRRLRRLRRARTSATSGSIAGCCRARPASRRSPTFAPRCSGTCRPRTSCGGRNGCAWSCRPRRSTTIIPWWPRWRRRRQDSGAPALPVGGWSAASDGGYLMRDARIPTVLFGPGSIVNQAHRADEYVPLDEVVIGRAHLPDHGGRERSPAISQR